MSLLILEFCKQTFYNHDIFLQNYRGVRKQGNDSLYFGDPVELWESFLDILQTYFQCI